MSDDYQVQVDFEGNAEDLAASLARAIEGALGTAMREVQKEWAQIFRGSQVRNSTKQGEEQIRRVGRAARDAADETRRAAQESERLGRAFSGIRGEPFFERTEEAAEGVLRDLRELRDVTQRFAADPALAKHFRQVTQLAERAYETASLNARRASEEEETAFRKAAEQKRVIDQGQTTRARAEASERIVIAQQEGARVVAETRAAGQRRVEIIRAVVGQVRALERGLGAVFRGTATAFSSLVSGIGSGVSRLGGIFRRGDSQLAGGLQGSMTRRETILRSSLSRQERLVSSSVSRQTVQIQRLEQRLSSGVLGTATGRGGFGALLGGGLAIGGGFALIGRLRQLITAGADTTQALAVLQAQLDLTDQQMQGIRQTALDLGNDISLPGVSAKDATDAIQLLVKQFGSLGDEAVPAAQNAAKGVLQLSRATQSDAAASAQVVGAAINVFGVAADEATKVADQITGALTVAAGTSFDDFSAAFRQGATVFSQFQTPVLGAEAALVEFNVALAALARGGLVGSDAGTALRAFFLQANRGTADAKKNLSLLAERAGVVGDVFFDAEGNARSLTDSLDIMRAGLDRMSDKQRTTVLQKIFGTDAIRAAELLTKTSEETFDTIREGVLREGLAAKIAAAQNTGLRGAVDALNSVIETQVIVAYEKLNVALGNVVLSFAEFLNKVFSAGGGFALLRDAIKGAVAALGGLIALKGSIEIFRLLVTLARGLLTPFGLLALAVTAIGAAFQLLRENSPAFNRAMEQVGILLRDFIGPAVDFIIDKFNELVEFILGAAPTLNNIGAAVGDFILTNVRRAIDFIRSTVIPGFKNFVNFITDTAVPAVRDFFVDAFGRARDIVVSFWRRVEPIIEPIIQGFSGLVDAVRELFSLRPGTGFLAIGGIVAAAFAGFVAGGPLGAAVVGAGATLAALFATGLGDSLGGALAGIGEVIINALRGPFNVVREFFGRIFTIDNLQSLLGGFLDVVERIGFILGNIATDPRVIAAIAAIGALGVTIGFRLVQGVVRGVIDNVGDVFDVFVNEVLGIGGDFERIGRDIGLAIVIGLTAVFVGGRLLGGLRAALAALGVTAGRQFGQSLQQATAKSLTVGGAGLGGGARGFLQGLLGGDAAVAGARRDAAKVAQAATREFQRNLFQVEAAGRSTFSAVATSSRQGLAAGVRASRQLHDEAVRAMGAARLAGVSANQAIRDIGTSIRNLNFRGIRTGFGNLSDSLRGQGRAIGTGVGTALGLSVAAAFSAQMITEASSGGEVAIGIASLGVAIATAFAAGGPIVGSVVAGVGLIATVLGSLQDRASDAELAVKGLSDELRNVADSSEEFDILRRRVEDALDALKPEQLSALRDIGFSTDAFVEAIIRGGPALDVFFSKVRSGLENVGVTGLGAGVILGQLDDIADVVADERLNADNLRGMRTNVEQAASAWEQLGPAAQQTVTDIVIAAQQLEVIDTIRTAAAIQDVVDTIKEAAEEAVTAKERIEELLGGDYPDSLRQAIDDFVLRLPGLGSELESVFSPPEGATVTDQFRRATERNVRQSVREALSGIVVDQVELGNIRSVRGVDKIRDILEARINAQFGEGSPIALSMIAALDQVTADPQFRRQLRRQLRTLVGTQDPVPVPVPIDPEPQVSSLDPAVLAERMREALGQTGPRGAGLPGRGAALRGVGATSVSVPIEITPDVSVTGSQADIGSGIADAIAAGVATGAPRISAALNTALGQAIRSSGQLAALFVTVGAASASAFVIGLTSQAGAAARAGGALGTQATQGVAAGSSSIAQVGGAFSFGFAAGISAGSGTAVGAASSMASGAASAASGPSAFGAGVELAAGFALGIAAGASAAVNAAINLAQRAIAAARSALQISSPSRVFQEMGREIGRGLAAGIGDSESDISSAVNQAIDRALETARRAVPDAGVARAEAGAGLFRALQPAPIPGGPTEVDLHQAMLDARDRIAEVARIAEEAKERNEALQREIVDANKQLSSDIQGVNQSLTSRLEQIDQTLKDRIQAGFERGARELDVGRQRINLGGLGRQVQEGLTGILDDAVKNAAELRRKANESGKAEDREAAERAEARVASLRQQLRALNTNTSAGRQAANVILDFGQQIRDMGQSLIDSGASAVEVSRTMRSYRDQLIRAALAQGINRRELNQLIQQLGLTDAQLARFVETSRNAGRNARDAERDARQRAANDIARLRESTAERISSIRSEIIANLQASRSLNIATEAGRQNRSSFIDAFRSVREFGAELLRGGTSAQNAVAQMKALRDQIINTGRALGFSNAEIQELVRMLGLSDAQLAEFIRQLEELNEEITPPATPGGPTPGLPGPIAPVINIYPPFGDPEAIGLTAVNALAFALPS